VAVGKINHQLESVLKVRLMTIGFISSAFISLQSVPRLMVGAFLLFRVA
jgi:hypothetical protein